jgi:membrane-bound lytic murein transglycosylase B
MKGGDGAVRGRVHRPAQDGRSGVPRSRLTGSWAGAFGNPQFLPSAYLRVARDGDGDGFADIWTSKADTWPASPTIFAMPVGARASHGVRATVPDGFDRAANQGLITSPSCPRVHARHARWRTVAEWRRMGVIAQGSSVTMFLPA